MYVCRKLNLHIISIIVLRDNRDTYFYILTHVRYDSFIRSLQSDGHILYNSNKERMKKTMLHAFHDFIHASHFKTDMDLSLLASEFMWYFTLQMLETL